MNLTFQISWKNFSPEDAEAFQEDMKTRLWPVPLAWVSAIEPGADYNKAPVDSDSLRSAHYTLLSALAQDYAKRFPTMDAVICGYVDVDLYAPNKAFLIQIQGGKVHNMSVDTLL